MTSNEIKCIWQAVKYDLAVMLFLRVINAYIDFIQLVDTTEDCSI